MAKEIKLGLKIDIEGGQKVNGVVTGVTDNVNKLTHEINRQGDAATENYSKTRKGLESISQQLTVARNDFIQLFSLHSAMGLAKGILETNRSMEMLRSQLTSLTGTATASAKAFTFIQNFATDTPFEIAGLTKAFIQLQNYGIKPTTQVMEAITNQASKLGASQEILEGITRALGQAYAKGKLQAEEMMQLAERGVPVYELLAQVTGKNTEQLFEMSQKGLLTRDVIDQLIKKMGELSAGANANAMETLNGKISNLSDSWHRFEDALLQDKSEGLIKKVVNGWITILDGFNDYLERGSGTFGKIELLNGKIAKLKLDIKESQEGWGGGLIGKASVSTKQSQLSDLLAQRDYEIAAAHDARRADKKRQEANDQQAADFKHLADKNAAGEKSLKDQEARDKKSMASVATAAKSKAEATAKAYQQEREEVAKTLGGIQQETRLIGLSSTARQRSIELTHALAKAKGAEVEAIKAALAVQWQKIDADKLETAAGDALATQIDKYKQLTLSAREYYAAKLSGEGLNPVQAAPALQAFDRNVALEGSQKSTDAGRKALDEYNNSLDAAKSKTADLGAITSAVFDGALGGISAMAGAFTGMIDAIDSNTAALAANHAKQAEIAAVQPSLDKDQYLKDLAAKEKATDKAAAQEAKLNQEGVQAKLSGTRQIAGAVSSMLKKGSTEQRAAHAIEMGLAGIELAMNLQKLFGIGAVTAAETASVGPSVSASTAKGSAKATEAIATQAGAGPYIGFALMAAMAVAMAALGFNAGGGATQVPAPVNPLSPDSGTVLGDSEAKSESISNTYTLLQDIHAKEFRELRGINDGVSALQKGITDSITLLFQKGGLKVPAAALAQVGSFQSKTAPTPIANFIMGGLFGKTKTKITDGGFYAGGNSIGSLLNGGQLSAQQYTEITKTKKSWFGSKSSVSEVMSNLDPEFRGSLTKIFKGMGTEMQRLTSTFGADMSASISNYVIPKMKVSLNGLTAEQMTKKLNNVLSTQMDKMTTTIFGSLIATYQQLGEGMYQTATRLFIEKALVLKAIDMTGGSFTGDAIAMADGLAQLAGGIEDFQAIFEDYYSRFYTDAEQLVQSTKNLSGIAIDLGVGLPATRTGYRDLINAQDLSTIAGRKVAFSLMELSEAADDYYAAQEELKKTAEDSLRSLAGLAPTVASAIYNLNLELIDARENWFAAGLSVTEMASLTAKTFAKLKDELLAPFIDARASIADQLASANGTQVAAGDISGMTEALAAMTDPTEQMKQVAKIQKAVKLRYDNEISLINKTTSALKGISDFLAGLQLSDLSTLSPEQKLQEAKGQYGTALLKAQAGNSEALASLPNLARQYLDEAKSYYATGESYAAIFDQVNSVLGGLTDATLSTTDTVKAATDAANAGLTSSLTSLDSILAGFVTSLGAQFDSILGTTTTPDVGAVAGGLTGNGGTRTYNSLVAARDGDLAALGAANTNKRLKGVALLAASSAAGYSGKNQNKDFLKAQTALAAQEKAEYASSALQLKNYNYWHELGEEAKALQSVEQVKKFAYYQQFAADTTYSKADRQSWRDAGKVYLEENGGLLHFRAKGGMTQGRTVIHEDGPELLNFARPTMVVNNEKTRSIIALGNEETVAELKKSNVELAALVRLQQAANQQLIDKLDSLGASMTGLERNERLKAMA